MIRHPQDDHCDLGLVDDDRTEDMRKAPVANTEARREPTQHQKDRRTPS
jgi:hypothetical protein